MTEWITNAIAINNCIKCTRKNISVLTIYFLVNYNHSNTNSEDYVNLSRNIHLLYYFGIVQPTDYGTLE